MHPALTRVRPAALALVLLALGAAAVAAAPHPGRPTSCKPQVPVDVELRLLDHAAGQPVHFETRIVARRPVEDLRLDLSFTGGARWAGGLRELAGRMDAGAQRALPMGVALPDRGHAEVFVKVTFRIAGGSVLTRGAYLSFDDGQPSRPAQGREGRWDGNRVLEFPAAGVSR